MATIGLSKPYVAKYSENDGVVTYSEGTELGGAVEFSATIESGEDNNLYANNVIVESDRSFGGGTLSITTDDLNQKGSALILGIEPKALTVPGITGDDLTEMVFDDDAETPYLGFGVIIKKKKGSYLYRAVVFTKIMFSVPEDAATTQNKTIEWKTPTLEATILRDDTEKHAWKREATFSSESDAEKYIKHCLNIVDTPAPAPGS